MKLHAIGIELRKNVFSLVALDSSGQVVIRKRCSRMQALAFTASVDVQMIGIQACDTARFLERVLRDQGHQVCLIPAANANGCIPANGHDYLSAEAIAEAARLACGSVLEVRVPLDHQHESNKIEAKETILKSKETVPEAVKPMIALLRQSAPKRTA